MKTKFKKILGIVLCCALMFSLVPITALAKTEPPFSGGQGTKDDPWIISDADDLVGLSNFVNDKKAEKYDADSSGAGNFHGYYFKQSANIDLNGKAWEPIGYSGGEGLYFSGNYDGDGHKISNAKSDGKQDGDGYATAGIFGWVYDGSVSNLKVVNADFSAEGKMNYSYVGGVTGVAYGAKITNCAVSDSTIESKRTDDNTNCAGGVAGYSTGSKFEKCSSVNNTVKSQEYGGGFVGELDDDDAYGAGKSDFTDCYVAKNKVSSDGMAGGFVGEVTATVLNVKNSYVYDTDISGKVKGVFAGNLWSKSSSINDTNCYYGEVGGVNENTGSAAKKSKEEFTNSNVSGLLGDVFVQGKEYPIFNGPADYSEVDAAIEKANALNKDDYEDFTPVENAIKAVVRDKKIPEQEEVDKMAKDIEDAINGLKKKEPVAPTEPSKDPQKDSQTVPDGENTANTDTSAKDDSKDSLSENKGNNNTASSGNSTKNSASSSSSNSGKNNSSTSPATGVNDNIFLWIVLLSAGVCITVFAVSYSKKKRANN